MEKQSDQERQVLSLQVGKAPLVIFIDLACCLLQSTANAKTGWAEYLCVEQDCCLLLKGQYVNYESGDEVEITRIV